MDRPNNYTKHSVLQRRDNEFTMDSYLKLVRWKRFPKILDLGCGDGVTTSEVLHPRVPRDYAKVVGIDLQEKMIQFAKESNKNSKMHFVEFDIAADTLLPEKYDHIFSFFAFHWVAKLRKAFENAYDTLTPGGSILINMVSEIPYYDLMKRQLAHPVWCQYFTDSMIPPFHNCRNPVNEIHKHLIEVGFTDIKIYTEERDFDYDSWVHCLKSLLALDPIISKLDVEQKEEYIVDFFFALKDIFGYCEQPNGQIRMPYKMLVVYAAKPELERRKSHFC